MADQSNFIPGNPVNIAIRPLEKGIIRNIPSEAVPKGGFVDIEDFRVGAKGLTRRGDWILDGRFDSFATSPPLRDVWIYWDTDGKRTTLGVDNEGVYEFARAADGSYSATTISMALNTLETFTYNGRLIGGLSYPDSTIIENNLVVSDSENVLRTYDGSTTANLSASLTYIPTCITFFRDRLFIGQIQNDSSAFPRQRIRWSNVSPNYDTFDDSAYVDLPYTSGAIWRLIPFSSTLVAFLDDAIFMGRVTSSPNLPVYFEQIETGGAGLVGMRAVTGWLDRLFFTGKNNVYELTTKGIKPIGDPVMEEVLQGMGTYSLAHTVMYTDTKAEKIGVVLSNFGTNLDVAWEMDLATGAWSRISLPAAFGFIKETAISFPITIGTFADTSTTIGDATGTFGDYTTDIGKKRLYFGGGESADFGYLASIAVSTGYDFGSIPVQGSFETGDIDLDIPNRRKLWTRFSMKIAGQLLSTDEPITFKVDESVDRGQGWKSLGTLVIAAGTDEGKINFRMSGAMIRFRVRQTSANPPYTIVDMVLRAKPRGREDRYE